MIASFINASFRVLSKASLLRFPVQKRFLNCSGDSSDLTGLVLGVYSEDADSHGQEKTFTKAAEEFDKRVDGKLSEMLKLSGPVPKKGETRIFYGIEKQFSAVVIVGIGDSCQSYSDAEQIDERKESIRLAAASGVRALQKIHIRTAYVESFGHAESSAEGAALGVWVFQELKHHTKHKFIPRIELFADCDYTGWQIGLQKAAAQNLARQLCETPANLLTPISFAQSAVEILCKAGVNVEVKVRNWAKIMQMEAFLAAARGSCEPPIFVEVSYYGCEPDVAPIVLVGKGVTFDSGGLCLKTCPAMKHMRGDMAGAASVVGACRAVSALQLPINIRGILPLYENLPGTCAMKPGDIIKAKNGKTILVENTDFDGRISLTDALSYSVMFNPKFILDIGTLCSEMQDFLGAAAVGAFSNSDSLYDMMRVASIHTGDRIWRMPLWRHFTNKVTAHPGADVRDIYQTPGAPCTCAAFLKEFIPPVDWIHLDTYGVNLSDGETWSYLRKGMSGRPTRTVVEFLAQLACKHEESKEESKHAHA